MAHEGSGFCSRFHQAVELIGRRWAGAIIQVLLGGRARYGAIRGAIPDINDRMLSERLRELEAEGIVTRYVLPESPPRVEYELTAKGRALEASIGEIASWAQQWVPAVPDDASDATTKQKVDAGERSTVKGSPSRVAGSGRPRRAPSGN
ncbi:MAG: winged helix-turn-helix transcriptional regulator [Gemmatimonadaceae bacterium]